MSNEGGHREDFFQPNESARLAFVALTEALHED